jgi:hypothetical protein
MTFQFALLGSTSLYLLYAWLASAVVAQWLSALKGYGEKWGLASGLLLAPASVVGPHVTASLTAGALAAAGAAYALVRRGGLGERQQQH